jgi:hypothetical protein
VPAALVRLSDSRVRTICTAFKGALPRGGVCGQTAAEVAGGRVVQVRESGETMTTRAAVPAFLGRWWPAVTRQPAPAPHVKQRLTRGRLHQARQRLQLRQERARTNRRVTYSSSL